MNKLPLCVKKLLWTFLWTLCLSYLQVSEIEASNEKLQSMESKVALSEETIASLRQDKSTDDEVKSNFENEMQVSLKFL